MSPRRCGGRTEGEFSRVTQSSRKRSKRICAYLTSPLDGQIRECRAAVKSCDKVARPWESHDEGSTGHLEPDPLI